MARSKQVFIANDGSEFDTEWEADAHDKAGEMASTVDAYIAANEIGKGPAGLLRKHIPGYVAWAASQTEAAE